MANNERADFAAELARRRAEAGLSYGELATAAHTSRGYLHHVEHGRRWPSRPVVRALDAALGADKALLGRWALGEIGGRPARTASAGSSSPSLQRADAELALVSTADESARFLGWAEVSNVGDLTVEQMHTDVRQIAHSYLKVPTLPLFARARAVRDQAFALLAGRQRPGQSRDLHAVAGWSLTLLAWISTDLGQSDAADTHARAAWLCANNADHNGLRAWVRATQHTMAFWDHRYADAAGYAADGLNYATAGSAEALLASAWALDLAKAGRADEARAAFTGARTAVETTDQAGDELTGPFTCSADRAGGFWSDVHLALGAPADALVEADRAVAAFEAMPEPRRNHGSERMVRLQQVRAHLALGQLDGAQEAITPVLNTAPEHRVRPLLQRCAEVYLQTSAYPDGPTIRGMREALTVFRHDTVVQELSP